MVDSVHEHERKLRQLKCVVCGSPFVQLHHCHGGSMLELADQLALPNPGMAQRNNPFLQIPLNGVYHVGEFGIDAGTGRFKGVEEWERAFGTQKEHLASVSEQLGYDVLGAAQRWRQIHINKVFN